jgi:hypothetical protein
MCTVHNRGERRPARRAETLEARDLKLDRDALFTGRVDHELAVGRDRSRGTFSRWRTWRARRIEGCGPQVAGIGIEAEDDLRGARGYLTGESVAEALGFRRRGMRQTRGA